MRMFAVVLFACGGQPGPQGVRGEQGPPGPTGPAGASSSGVPFHWRDANDEVVSPHESLTRFDANGVLWSYSFTTMTFDPPMQSTAYALAGCEGQIMVPGVYAAMQAIDVNGAPLYLPASGTPAQVRSWQSRNNDGDCVDTAGNGLAVLLTNLVAAGPPPAVDWAQPLHPVEGAP